MFNGSLNATAERLSGVRVLIVEDSWHIAKAMESVLKEVGMVIAGAAATMAGQVAPKVAVVDIMLRDGMAFDLIDRLHDLGVPVVVVSGFATFPTPLGRTAAILPKPVAGRELVGALARVCC